MSGLPEWMIQSENYIPEKDSNSYVKKSILKLLSMLSRLRMHGGVTFRGNAAVRLFVMLIFILLISLSKNMFFVYIMLAVLLVRLIFVPGKVAVQVLAPGISAALFSVLMLIPSAFMGSPKSMIFISLKVFISASMVNVFAVTIPWNYITDALKTFFVPDIFIFILEITLKNIIWLGDIAYNMLSALNMRQIGHNRNKSEALEGILGTLFIKTKESSDVTYNAMMLRGFTGEYRRLRKKRFTLTDAVYLLVLIAVIAVFIYFERLV